MASDIEKAEQRRDDGIARVTDHTERVSPNWFIEANRHLAEFLAATPFSFLSEDFVAWAKFHGLENPPDGRVYGAVIRRAAIDGVIQKVGYGLANTSNRSPKVLWKGTKWL